MSDPKHWLGEDGEATGLERELLRAGREVKLSPHVKRGIWLAITAEALPAAAAAGAAGTGVGIVKGIALVTLVSGTLASGVWVARHRGAPAAHGPVVAAASSSVTAPGSAAPASEHTAPSIDLNKEATSPVAATPDDAKGHTGGKSAARARSLDSPTPESSAEALRESRLREESLAVVEIEARSEGGDPTGALHLLEQARSRFPDGALTQEREALAIEAMAKSGQRAAASQRAAAFLRAFPRSPHAADVRAYLAK